MPTPSQIHDKLFKALMEQPGAAGALIRERLPGPLAALLSDDTPEPVDGSFIDEALRGSVTDRLFRARLKDGNDLLLYCLLDHKSQPDPGTPLQILRYITRIWVRHTQENPNTLRRLPPIVPIVPYHGAVPWTVPTAFGQSVAGAEATRPYQPEFQYVLIDLGPIPDLELSAHPLLRAGLLALKYAYRDRGSEALMIRILADAGESETLFAVLTVYMLAVYEDVTPAALRQVVRRVKPQWEETMLSIAARQWMAEGREEGREEGLSQGRADLLLRMLRRKFRDVPDDTGARLRAADVATLDEWGERLVDAQSLDEVFASKPPH